VEKKPDRLLARLSTSDLFQNLPRSIVPTPKPETSSPTLSQCLSRGYSQSLFPSRRVISSHFERECTNFLSLHHSVFIPPSSPSFFKFQPLSPINSTSNKACASSSKSDTRNHTRDLIDTPTPTLQPQRRQLLQQQARARVSPPVTVPPIPSLCLHTDPPPRCVLLNSPLNSHIKSHIKSHSNHLLSTHNSCTYSGV
jgi:hypothetical protein